MRRCGCGWEEGVSHWFSEAADEEGSYPKDDGKKDQPPTSYHAISSHAEEAQVTGITDRTDSEPKAECQAEHSNDDSSLDSGVDI